MPFRRPKLDNKKGRSKKRLRPERGAWPPSESERGWGPRTLIKEERKKEEANTVKILLVVIDAATPRVVCPAIRIGRLPVMQRLTEAGTLHETSVSIFPSITPAATMELLDALDSLSPVITAGGPAMPKLPRHMRSIDIAPLCMQLLGLPMRYRPGDPRALQ
jgi:hypothetical protein